MSGRLDGKTAIVTGAGSGIGRGIAERFSAEGAFVLVADINADAAAAVADAVNEGGAGASAITLDVTRGEDHDRVVAAALASTGRLDVLVSNAGVGHVARAVELTEADWDRVLKTNLTGMWLGMRAVLPSMTSQGSGSIINMASITALHGYPGVAAYSASKGGVVALTRQVAADYASAGIRVNAIAPGTVHTPLTQGLWDSGGGFGGTAGSPADQLAAAARGYPLGRLGTAQDIAAMAVHLAADDGAWITGQVYVVDGGKTSI